MYSIIVIFLIIATVLAIGTILYVIFDILFEKRQKKEEPKVEVVAQPEPEPEPEPEPVVVPVVVPVPDPDPEPEPEPIVIPVVLEQVDAEEADALISDEEAEKRIVRERGAGKGRKGEINLGVINEHFEPGEVITLAALQAKKLVSKKERRIKILADGILTKSFVIKAEAFSKEAVKMIELMGGTVIELY